jgi:branched-chain amino acid transport system permease protein
VGTTKFVTVQKTRIAYWEQGLAELPTLVYVHGNTGSKVWFELAMDIPGYRVIAPDLPNFGESDRIETADIDRYAAYLAEFMATLEVQGAYVVGHSLGGAVAISLAVHYSSLVARLMLVDPAPLDGLHTPEEYYPVIERYKEDPALLKEALRAVTPTMKDEQMLDRLTDSAMQMNPIAFAGNPRALDRFDYRGRVSNVEIPVMVLRGELDPLITEEMGRATANGFPNGEFRSLRGVGHSVMVEDPARFKATVQDFAAV